MNRVIVDAGQSGVRILLSQASMPDVTITLSGIRADTNGILQVAAAIRQELPSTHDAQGWSVAAGITGLTPAHGGAGELLGALPTTVTSAIVGHDSATGYLGALGTTYGTVLAVGTGVVVIACSESTTRRVDGWGHLLGDLGGGFWIGAHGLTAALESFDGRAPFTKLLDRAIARFGAVSTLPSVIYENPNRVADIAAFCVDVVSCAANGDAPAQAIVTEAARQLARSANASLNSVNLSGDDRLVSWSGNLIDKSDYVRRLISDELESLPSPARLITPRGAPLDGAHALIDLSANHPLYATISRAYRSEK